MRQLSIRLNKIDLIYKIIFIMFVISPILNIGEVLNIFLNFNLNIKDSVTPIYIKALKDELFLLLILILSSIYFKKEKYNFNEVYFLGFLFIFIPLLFFTFLVNKYIFFSGIRWGLPILVFVLGIRLINKNFLEKFYNVLWKVFLLHFFIQLIEFLFLTIYTHNNPLGFRHPGMFLQPNTAGLFTVCLMVYFYFINFLDGKKIFLIFSSILLSGSSTAILIFFIIYAAIKVKRMFYFIFIAPFFIFLGYNIVEYFRPRVFSESLFPRIELLLQNFYNSDFYFTLFGIATNTAVSLSTLFNNQTVSADAFWGGLSINIGWFFAIFLFLLNIFLIFYSLIYNNKKAFILFITLFLYGFTSSYLEAYPTNLIIALLLAYIFNIQRRNQKCYLIRQKK
jgi:hypothetical protein